MSSTQRIELETLTPPTEHYPSMPEKELFELLNKGPKKSRILQSSKHESLAYFGTHSIFYGFLTAFKQHRPLTISPDIIWLLIIQGFSTHISKNPEKYRNRFVDFDGKQTITVDMRKYTLSDMTPERWRESLEKFMGEIKKFVSGNVVDILSSDFTTSTFDSTAVSRISIMSVLKHYFDYRLLIGGCGIPYIDIEGTVEDWEKLNEKLDYIEGFDLEWWISEVRPIIGEIINTKKNNINHDFWRRMVRIYEYDGSARNTMYSKYKVDGWFVKLFPYDRYGDKTNLESFYVLLDGDDKLVEENYNSRHNRIPHELLTVPFTLAIMIGAAVLKEMKCEFVGGFIGMKENQETYGFKPEIGWYVRVLPDEKDQDDYDDFE